MTCRGSGGKGGSRTTNGGGGGGGGGGYAKTAGLAVIPGVTYTIVVGAGSGTTDTSFGGTLVVAGYGASVANNIATGGAGGAGVTGDTKYTGGAGGTGGVGGGGGGEGARSNGTGGAGASPGAGGTGGDGGDGGAGRTSTQGNGTAGSAPGGGGGGGYRTSSSTRNGGAGAAGSVVLVENFTKGPAPAVVESFQFGMVLRDGGNYNRSGVYADGGAPAGGLALADIGLHLVALDKTAGTLSEIWDGSVRPTAEVAPLGMYIKAYADADLDAFDYFAGAQYAGS